MVRGELPYWPAPGLANALALKNRASGCAAEATRSASPPLVFGSPVGLGLCPPPNGPRLASDAPLLITALSGPPLTSSTIADPVQPPSAQYAALPLFFGPGRLTIGASTIRCGES